MFGDMGIVMNQLKANQSEDDVSASIDDAVLAGADRQYLVVSVRDNGVGIAKEDIPKMFKNIVQFNPNELQGGGGSGLGMVLSRGIVERHAGKMWLHSEGLGLGSTFAFGVPLSKRKEPTADPQTGLPLEEHPEGSASGGWVRKKPNGQVRVIYQTAYRPSTASRRSH
jgi:signal transduction histidine kinase